MYYDVHTHLFNKDFISKELLYRLLLELRNIIYGEDDRRKEHLRSSSRGIIQTIRRINRVLRIVLKSSSTAIYAELNKIYEDEYISVPLMMDLTWCFDSKPLRDDKQSLFDEVRTELQVLYQQSPSKLKLRGKLLSKKESRELEMIEKELQKTEVLLKQLQFTEKKEQDIILSSTKTRSYPDSWEGFNFQILQLEQLKNRPGNNDKILPFLAVDPRRKGIVEYAKNNVGRNKLFSGIKIYTPTGYSPTNPILYGDENNEGLYAFCQRNKIPITAHSSSSGFATLSGSVFVNGHIWKDGRVVYYNNEELIFKNKILKAGKAIRERADLLNNPELWKIVAKKFPKLKVNLAHFGGGDELLLAMNNPNDKSLWSNKIIELISNPDYNFYTDISCYSDDDYEVLTMLKNSEIYPKIKHKILYGSDFFLNMLFDDSMSKTLQAIKAIFAEDFEIIARENPKRFLSMNVFSSICASKSRI